MILADTSLWIDYFNEQRDDLRELIAQGKLVINDVIIGEIITGNIRNRKLILSEIGLIKRLNLPTHQEAFEFIESKKLMGHGLSYNDVLILMSALLSNCKLWAADKALKAAAKRLGCAYILN